MLALTPGTTKKAKTRVIAPFDALGWQAAPWRDRSGVLLLTGSAGGGKSRLAAEKLHGYCLKYPGASALLVRKARVSITNSTAELLRRVVIGDDPRVVHVPSKSRFEYRNGSTLLYTGLDDEGQRQRLRSIGTQGGIDIAWMEEATEFEEDDYNAVLARLRGRAAPWRQIILTTNPDAPTHWIYRRLIAGGEARIYYSAATDNPHNPDDYVQTLASLTGVEGDRLARGQWVQAVGIVYDVWSDPGNVTEDADYIPDGGDVLWGVDDGYSGALDKATGLYTATSHPRVFGLYQLRHDGTLCRFAESYACGLLSDRHIAEAMVLPHALDDYEKPSSDLSWVSWAEELRQRLDCYPLPEYAVVDSSAAELRGRLSDAGIPAFGGTHSVEEGIKVMRRFLALDANGRRRLLVHPRCTQFRAEMASYRRDADGRLVKAFDHGPDECRMVCYKLRYE
jgi:terminase large subunit-like protein